jgi:PhnB protein
MNVKQLNPYLHFNGEAAEAIAFYERALGATQMGGAMRYDAAPMPIPEDHKSRIMHCCLQVGDRILMVSDGPPGFVATRGNASNVAVEFVDDAELAQAYAALGEGGTVTMPLDDTFWGGRMGMLVDKFGVPWMLLRNPKGAM